MLKVILPDVIILNVISLNVIIMSVMFRMLLYSMSRSQHFDHRVNFSFILCFNDSYFFHKLLDIKILLYLSKYSNLN